MPLQDPLDFICPSAFLASQFHGPNAVLATWGSGIRSVLPPCTHIWLSSVSDDCSKVLFHGTISPSDLARVAASRMHPLADGAIGLDDCKSQWSRLIRRARPYLQAHPSMPRPGMFAQSPAKYMDDQYYFPSYPAHVPGETIGPWTNGAPALLPPCSHVRLMSFDAANRAAPSSITIRIEELRDVAARWFHPASDGRIRLRRCTGEDWRDVLKRAAQIHAP